jgi:hypothetical protein
VRSSRLGAARGGWFWWIGSSLMACSTAGALDAPSLASHASRGVSVAALPDDSVESIPVPPADGPRLAPVDLASPVYAKPDKQAEKIGYLRIGARLARSEEAVSMRDCARGWYAVRPLGFMCAEEGATLNLEAPVVRALQVEPDRSKPMPYDYAFATTSVPNYMRLPTPIEQIEHEPGLGHHLRSRREPALSQRTVMPGANDVPLGRNGLALGPIVARAPASGMNVEGAEVVPWWLRGQRMIPNVATVEVPTGALVARTAQRRAGVALIGSFASDEKPLARRFAITTDGRLLPSDKLQPEAGSTFHGHDLRELGLPVAFGWKKSARFWSVEQGRLVPGRSLARREFVPLTGKVRNMAGARMVQARDQRWLRSDDVRIAAKPNELPWFAGRGRNWIDVSLLNQTLVLWEGDKPVYATLVSTGKGGLGDPKHSLSTPQGIFRVQQKHVTTTMDSSVADNEFELRDVPWVMYFTGGYALHGAYWHDDFGRTRSHGCVNLSPIDARYVFEWSLPDVPEHWHGAYASDSFGSGTLIRIGR